MIPQTTTPLFTDDVLARLRRVILQSRRLARTGLTGEHRSLRKGPSPEFADYKAYSVGDDYRRIDWRVYARFDSLYVRESEITAEFDVHLLVDVSRSMEWSSSHRIAGRWHPGHRQCRSRAWSNRRSAAGGRY